MLKSVRNKVRIKVENQVWIKINMLLLNEKCSQIYNQISNRILEQLKIGEKMLKSVKYKVYNPIFKQVRIREDRAIEDELHSQAWPQVGNQIQTIIINQVRFQIINKIRND